MADTPVMNDTPVTSGSALVIVADAARARLLTSRAPNAALQDVEAMLNPLARLHENDIVDDEGGRRNGRPTRGQSSIFGGETGKQHRIEEFAGQVCARIADAVRDQKIDRIYLIAEPAFLGLLRMRLDASLRKRVAGEVPKSLANHSLDQIRSVLPGRL